MPTTIFKPNITNDYDPIVFECDSSYETWEEVLKYTLQAIYLIPGGFLNALLLYTLWIKDAATYRKSSFFMIFSADCLVSLILIVCDVFVGRLFIYFTPLCPILAPLFYEPLVVYKFIMVLINHAKACKSLIQCLLVSNRMSAVLSPLNYGPAWNNLMKYAIPLVFLLPITIDWNLAISRVYMMPTFGGFYMEYIKKVSWASQSRFQLVFIITALVFTGICTSVTLYRLCRMPQRWWSKRGAEKSISIATVYISIGFISVGVFQVLFGFFGYLFTTSAIFGLYHLSYDFLNVGSPIIMIMVDKKLRKSAFSGKSLQEEQVFSQSTMTREQAERRRRRQRRRLRIQQRLDEINSENRV